MEDENGQYILTDVLKNKIRLENSIMYVNTKEYSDFLYKEMMKLEELFKKKKERKMKENKSLTKNTNMLY